MKSIRTLIPVALLSVALLAGCGSQAQAPDTGEAAAEAETEEQAPDAAEQDEEAEPAPEPAMSNWYDKTFYERPVTEIASDLELLGFEVTAEYYDDSEYANLSINYQGTPEVNPLDGTSDTAVVFMSVYQPAFADGATDQTHETLAEGTMPTGFNVSFFYPETPDSEYEGLAQNAAETLGLGEVTDSSLSESFAEPDRMIGNYSGAGTYQGNETEWLIMVSTYDADIVPDVDYPTMVDVSYYIY